MIQLESAQIRPQLPRGAGTKAANFDNRSNRDRLIPAVPSKPTTLMSVADSRGASGNLAARLGRIGADHLAVRTPARSSAIV